MAKTDNLIDFLKDIADAIREKKGTNDPINAQDFADEIKSGGDGGGGMSSSYRGQIWDTLFNPAPVDDGATTLFINITRENQKDFVVVFVQDTANGVTIDWGDGNTETKSKINSYNYCEHTYSSLGRYQIKLIPKEGCTYELGSGSTTYTYSVIGNTRSTSLYYFDACYRVDVGRNVTNIGKAFHKTWIQQVNFVNDDVSIDSQSFYDVESMYYLKIPKRAKIIGYRAFFESTSVVLYDFSEIEAVPTLDAEAFGNITLYNIIVPDSLYDEFISATNWSNVASHIVKLSDIIK